jgi:hypothetical protein
VGGMTDFETLIETLKQIEKDTRNGFNPHSYVVRTLQMFGYEPDYSCEEIPDKLTKNSSEQ